MILAPKISHTFLSEGRSVLALLTGSEITLFFRCSEGSIALTKVDFPTPECPENILTLPIIISFNCSTLSFP
jgi:hypothetical protein